MAQKQRKTVPQSARFLDAEQPVSNARQFAQEVPELAFLVPVKRRSFRRLRAVKKLLARILGSLVPVLAEQEPDTLQQILKKS